jgi:hypothetical protein
MMAGIPLATVGIALSGGAVQFLPDPAPLAMTGVIFLAGAVLFGMGVFRSEMRTERAVPEPWTIFSWGIVAALFVIPLALLPRINWERPGDPCAMMILCFLTAAGVVYALVRHHRARRQIVAAAGLSVLNFCLIPVYEAGFLNGIGQFYRLFGPVYASFDAWATGFEFSLIALTMVLVILLTVFFAFRKRSVADFGTITLLYIPLQLLLAIFLFEMVGNPAGFLAGATTRSDLLVTDTNAIMSTFGMLFIAVPVYIAFQYFPLIVPPVLAGLWWPFWKMGLLHHPSPAFFPDLSSMIPAVLTLFGMGLKRAGLPMVVLLIVLLLTERMRARHTVPDKGD